MLEHVCVAFASGIEQTEGVFNLNVPAIVGNQSCFLQRTCSHGHAGAAGPEHVGQKFLSQGNCFRVYAVAAHQQPARQSFVYFVQTITGSHLGALHGKVLHITLGLFPQLAALAQGQAKILSADSESRTFDLHHGARGTGGEVRNQR